MPPHLIARLLALATAEFKAETYDINKVARTVLAEMDQQPPSAPPAVPSPLYSKQVIHFCACLGGLPRYYMELLNE